LIIDSIIGAPLRGQRQNHDHPFELSFCHCVPFQFVCLRCARGPSAPSARADAWQHAVPAKRIAVATTLPPQTLRETGYPHYRACRATLAATLPDAERASPTRPTLLPLAPRRMRRLCHSGRLVLLQTSHSGPRHSSRKRSSMRESWQAHVCLVRCWGFARPSVSPLSRPGECWGAAPFDSLPALRRLPRSRVIVFRAASSARCSHLACRTSAGSE
jgi:hypothetical protein